MRKLVLLLVVLVLFGSLTAGAQKKNKRNPAVAPPTSQTAIIQDEKGEGFMCLDLSTGAYKCVLCEYDYYYSAQNKSPTPPIPRWVIIQDQGGEGFMTLDFGTGAYVCELCEYDYSFKGVGSVSADGCRITFVAVEDGYSMAAYMDLCEQFGKCLIKVADPRGPDPQPWKAVLRDPNLSDSEAVCEESELLFRVCLPRSSCRTIQTAAS